MLNNRTYAQVDMFCPECDMVMECDAVRSPNDDDNGRWYATIKCINRGHLVISVPCDPPKEA